MTNEERVRMATRIAAAVLDEYTQEELYQFCYDTLTDSYLEYQNSSLAAEYAAVMARHRQLESSKE